jgi:chromosome segregation ATPase
MGLFGKKAEQNILSFLEKISDKMDSLDNKIEKLQAVQEKQEQAIKTINKQLEQMDNKSLNTKIDIQKIIEDVLSKVKTLSKEISRISSSTRDIDRLIEYMPTLSKMVNDIHKQINLMPPSQLDFEEANDDQKSYIVMVDSIIRAIEDSRKKLDDYIFTNRKDIIEAVNAKSLDYANQLTRNINQLQDNLFSVIYETAGQNRGNSIDYEQIKQIIRNETRPAGSRNSYL